jgi:hypothetical protein
MSMPVAMLPRGGAIVKKYSGSFAVWAPVERPGPQQNTGYIV